MSAPSALAGRRSRSRLGRAIVWDLRLQLRYRIITVAAAVTALYAVVLRLVPAARADEVLVILIFSDPTMIGFLFLGVLVLFERGAGTLAAVVVTPLAAGEYLWSKAVSLTAIAVPCAVVMAWAGAGTRFDAAALVASVALSSLLFVFVGFVAVARVRTVNAYLLIVPSFLVPLNVPFLGFFGLVETPLFYAFPTQASLVLLSAAFASQPAWEMTYAIAYLAASVAVAYRLARRSFDTQVRREGG